MREYEVMLVIDSGYDEENAESVLKKFEGLLAEHQGSVLETERWGKRRLAYPIKKKFYGFYVLMNANIPGEAIQPIRKYLDRSEAILRYSFLHLDKRTKKLILKQEQIKKARSLKKATKEAQTDEEGGKDK